MDLLKLLVLFFYHLPIDSKCGNEFELKGSHCVGHWTYSNFINGFYHCYNKGGVLPDQNGYKDARSKFVNMASFFLQANDLMQEGRMVWMDGTVLENIRQSIGDCTAVMKTFSINPTRCSANSHVICQEITHEFDWRNRKEMHFVETMKYYPWINQETEGTLVRQANLVDSLVQCALRCKGDRYPCVAFYWSQRSRICLLNHFMDAPIMAEFKTLQFRRYSRH